jgi:hypothetical protein
LHVVEHFDGIGGKMNVALQDPTNGSGYAKDPIELATYDGSLFTQSIGGSLSGFFPRSPKSRRKWYEMGKT